jgi:small subunit ribosomal protein S5
MRERRFEQKAPSEFDSKVIDIRRTARVVSGGRRFSFRVSVVIGNRKGEVGVGIGKGVDTASAIEKATRLAKRSSIKVPLTKNSSIAQEVYAKYASARVYLKPTSKGKGLIAGSSVRTVLEFAGVRDVSAKIFSRSKNKLNNAKAAITALKKLI